MASTPNASHPKRRLWLDRAANSVRLTKPFRSPLKSSIAHHADAAEQAKASHGSNAIDTNAASSSFAIATVDDIDGEANVDTLYKQYRNISRQITQTRQSLDTAQQAVNILQNDQTATIEALIEKWKGVVRDAADELYSQAKEQVEREGSLRRPRRRFSGVFEEAELSLTTEQQEMLRAQQEEDRAQALKYGLVESIEETDDDLQDKTLTMATMLRQMDVDLDLVGYNEKEERWVA